MTNICVIGCGRWGPNHIRNFNGLPGSRVIAAVDVNKDSLSRISVMFPGIAVYREYQRVLEDPTVTAVVVATPTSTHYSIVRDALLAGKHVLCEKPLCRTSEHVEELVELADSCKLALMVGHVFVFNPGILKMKELLDAQELGEIHYVAAARTNLGPIRSDVNAGFDLASHDIAIFNWLLRSEPELVSAMGASFLQRGVEDVVFISLRYPGNVFGHIQASWLNPKKVRQISIVGSKKMITWNDLELDTPIAIYDKGAQAKSEYNDFGEFLRVSMWDGDVRLPKVHYEEPLKAQDSYFLDAIQNGGVVKRSGGDLALGVVRTLEAIAESVRTNGTPVLVEP